MKDYKLVQSRGFRNVILTLYRCPDSESSGRIVDFAATHELFAITLPQSRCHDVELAHRLNRLGVPLYVHTINDTALFKTLQRRGFGGIYSDTLTSGEVSHIAREDSSGAQRVSRKLIR